MVVDVRGGTSFHSLREQLARHLPTRRTSMLFLEADDDILVRRQEAARRPHPLQGGGRLLEGIHREREVMTQLRGDADVVVDTTQLNLHQLKDKVAQAFGDPGTTALKITVVSFGDGLADPDLILGTGISILSANKCGRPVWVASVITGRVVAGHALRKVASRNAFEAT